MREYELVIVGGGASGILCAIEAYKKGINNILLIEKDPVLGGALNSGDFNISKDKKITGKEYKEDLMKEFEKTNVEVQLGTMVLKIEDNNEAVCTSSKNGIEKIKGKNIILTNGGKEGSRKAVAMVGDRCSGIYTVGMAKKIFAMENMTIGKNILIFGNETLYMIEKVLKEHKANIVGIVTENGKFETFGLCDKVYEGYTIEEIHGAGRLSSVTLAKGHEKLLVDCDTLMFAKPMLSDGLVAMRSGITLSPSTTGPVVDENFMTSRDNIFACGNGIYIHTDIESIEDECRKLVDSLS